VRMCASVCIQSCMYSERDGSQKGCERLSLRGVVWLPLKRVGQGHEDEMIVLEHNLMPTTLSSERGSGMNGALYHISITYPCRLGG